MARSPAEDAAAQIMWTAWSSLENLASEARDRSLKEVAVIAEKNLLGRKNRKRAARRDEVLRPCVSEESRRQLAWV